MAPVVPPLRPLLLPVAPLDHEYLGGDRIAALRGGPGGPQRPEEWLGSCTARDGDPLRGLTVFDDGVLLRDLVEADPVGWLGAAHAARFGANPAVLVKLLDAGQRLPVHVHPTRAFAGDHLDCAWGKTEAWVILETPPQGAPVWVGCKRDVSSAELRSLVDNQDKSGLVDMLHQITVHPGDAVVVPSGLPHCTGEGILLMELQEPTDFSILLEWEGFAFDGPRDGHLGLGFDVALKAVQHRMYTDERLSELVQRNGAPRLGQSQSMFPNVAEPYFRAVRVAPASEPIDVAPSFAVALVTEGVGRIDTDAGSTPISRGQAFVVPHGAGTMRIAGDVEVLIALPPHPDAPLPVEASA